MTRRTEKVSSLIQQQLGQYLQKLDLPFLTTISKVEVTPDLKWGKVWITVLPAGEQNEQQVLGALKEELYSLQGQLNNDLKMRIVPRIKFEIDHSQEFAAHINQVLKQAHEEDDPKQD